MFKQFLISLISICLFFLCIFTVSKLSHVCKEKSTMIFGNRFQILFGSIGIMIHEFGHMIFAMIFGYQIDSFRLLNSKYKEDGRFGYVNTSMDSTSLYQRTGMSFVASGPFLSCTLIILGIRKILGFKNLELYGNDVIINSSRVFFNYFSNLNHFMIIPFTISIFMISYIGYDLSDSDMNLFVSGLAYALLIMTPLFMIIVSIYPKVINYVLIISISSFINILLSLIIIELVFLFQYRL